MAAKVTKQLTLQGLRTILSEQIEAIRDGKATAANVNAISNATGKILSSIKLELEYHKLVGKTPNMPALLDEPEVETTDRVSEFQSQRKSV